MVWLSDSIHRCCLSFGFCAGFWDTQILHIPSVVFFLLVHFIYWVTLFPFSGRGELLLIATFTLGTDCTVDSSIIPGGIFFYSGHGSHFIHCGGMLELVTQGVTMTTRIVPFFLLSAGRRVLFLLPCHVIPLYSNCHVSFLFFFSRQEYVADGLILIEEFVARGDSIDT